MMLTSVPPALLHHVRAAAAVVHDLAQLGLDLLCPCEDGHGPGGLRMLGEGEDDRSGMAERCYLSGCHGPGWVTGASDYCTPECELIAAAVGA